jgi:hypothetical protein
MSLATDIQNFKKNGKFGVLKASLLQAIDYWPSIKTIGHPEWELIKFNLLRR